MGTRRRPPGMREAQQRQWLRAPIDSAEPTPLAVGVGEQVVHARLRQTREASQMTSPDDSSSPQSFFFRDPTGPSEAVAARARDTDTMRDVVPFREAVRAWFAVSLQTFGGPAGQIAVMQRMLVDEKRWIGQKRFLHALSYCTLLPGP